MWMRASLMKAPSSTERSNSNNGDSSSSYTSSSYSSSNSTSGYSRHIKVLLSSEALEERDPKQ